MEHPFKTISIFISKVSCLVSSGHQIYSSLVKAFHRCKSWLIGTLLHFTLFIKSVELSTPSLTGITEKQVSLAAVNGLHKREKKSSYFPSGLIEVTVGSVVPRWPPPPPDFDPVTHFLSHLSVGPRGGESLP